MTISYVLVHVNVCDFADTMLIAVQINLIWFFGAKYWEKVNCYVMANNTVIMLFTQSLKTNQPINRWTRLFSFYFIFC